MNKNKSGKKLEHKKSIVRNPEQAKPKTVVIEEPEKADPSSLLQKTQSELCVSEDKPTTSKAILESPELNSAMRISRKIESVESIKPRKVKSIAELDRKKSTIINEKATKQVNFPYNKAIYKDLIPLCVKTQPHPLPSSSREIVVHKEKEPVLSDFFTPKVLPEYSFQVPVQTTQKTVSRQFDGLKLYRTMKNWN